MASARATVAILGLLVMGAIPHAEAQSVSPPAGDARYPTHASWWGGDWKAVGTATSCETHRAPNGRNVISMFASGFQGTLRGIDPATGRAGEATAKWDLLIVSMPGSGGCAPGYVNLTGTGGMDHGFLLALNFSEPMTTVASESLILGPGSSIRAQGVVSSCARGDWPQATSGMTQFRGQLTGRYLAPFHSEQAFHETTTFDGQWELVLVRPSVFPCDNGAVSFTAGSDNEAATLVALKGLSRIASPSPPAAPQPDPRLPTEVRWWRADDYLIEGTAATCWFTDHEGDRHVGTTGFLTDFHGTITGVDAATGAPLRMERQWDLVVADVPSSGDCRGQPYQVRVTGQSRGGAGFVVAADFPQPMRDVPQFRSLVLGPGDLVSGGGAVQACKHDLEQGTLAIAGYSGPLTGRYTRVPPDQFPPVNSRTTHEGSWDLVLVRDVHETATSGRCSSTGVAFEAGSRSDPGMLVALGMPEGTSTPTPQRPAPPAADPTPTSRTPCYDLLSCPIGDVSSLRSRILGVRGQVVTAAGAAVVGAPVLLLGQKDGALDLLSITQTLEDGSFNVPTTVAAPAYAATVLGGHVVLADLLSQQGGVPADGLLSLKLPVPPAAAAAQHAQLSAPEIQLLADAFSTAKPFGVPRASPTEPANIPIGGYAGIRGLAVRPSSFQEDARVVLVEMKDKGSPRIPDPPGGPKARYFAMQLADVEGKEIDVDEIVFEFEAPEGSEGKDIFLHHFLLEEQRWETLKPQRTEAGTYVAAVDSLSLFAVSTSQPTALGAIITNATDSPYTLPVLGGLVVVGIAAVAIGRLRSTRAGRKPVASTAAVAAIRATPLPEREALIADVSVTAKGTKILQGVSFSFAQGEILALLGPSGSGKSTLLKALLAENEFTGEISLFGIDPSRRDPQMKKLIGYVSQETELYPDMTLRENVEYFGRQYGLSGAELSARVDPLLATLGLTERASTRVGLLSGGQQRRASIAATLVHAPSLLILDEPTSGLDPVTRKSLWKFVRQASRDLGVTVIVTTHFLDEADLADRVVILNKGKVVRAGTPQELVRSLPGGGKAVVVELTSTSPAIEARVREAVKPLVERGSVSAMDLSGYSARFFTPNAQSAGRDLLDVFGRADVPVKQVTTEDCGMDAVFSFYAGERWREGDA